MKLLTTEQRQKFLSGVPIKLNNNKEARVLERQLNTFFPQLGWGVSGEKSEITLDDNEYPVIVYARQILLWDDVIPENTEVLELEENI